MATVIDPQHDSDASPSAAEANADLKAQIEATTPWNDSGKSGKFGHQLAMAIAVVGPFLGFVSLIACCWIYGSMNAFYLALLIGGWVLSGLGITIGFHRLLSHRSFDSFRWVKAMWMAFGALAVEGSPIMWCAIHRKHHQFSDLFGDPHSPRLHGNGWWNAVRGFTYAHTGWLFSGLWRSVDSEKYVPDLLEDKLLVAVDKVYYLWVLASLAIPAAIAGIVMQSWMAVWLGFLWGGLARIFLTHHITWSINSICHIFGSREFEAGDESRNNLLFGILGHGEGWHNNHHAFPTSARHGLRWWQFDLSWYIIRTMQMVGLAWDVRTPSARAQESKRLSCS